MPRVLYLTFDGLMEPIGTSQVLRPVLRLADRGFSYSVISLEKAGDLSDLPRQRSIEAEMASRGVRWVRARYQTGGARAVAANIAAVRALAREEARSVDLIHARAHLAAGVAWSLSRVTRTPYLFDFRGYWVDDLREQGRWLTPPPAYALAKAAERRLVCDAAGIVCLTELARDDIRAGVFGPFPAERPLETITTEAEFEQLTRNGPTDWVPEAIRSRLRDKLVIAYIGAINESYAYNESMRLCRRLISLRADAHVLCLTRQVDAMHDLLRAHGITDDRATVTHAPHEEMSHWLRCVDWCLLLLHEPFAKRGSMPTKLAELFAAEVRPVQHGCNPEVSDWVRRARSGIVLRGLDDASLDAAAERIAGSARDPELMARARVLTATHFAAGAGSERYAAILSRLTRSSP